MHRNTETIIHFEILNPPRPQTQLRLFSTVFQIRCLVDFTSQDQASQCREPLPQMWTVQVRRCSLRVWPRRLCLSVLLTFMTLTLSLCLYNKGLSLYNNRMVLCICQKMNTDVYMSCIRWNAWLSQNLSYFVTVRGHGKTLFCWI